MRSIQIKRRLPGGASGAPDTMLSGEVAWNGTDHRLYYGEGNNGSGVATAVIEMGGQVVTYDTVAALLSAVSGGKTFKPGTLVIAGGMTFMSQAGAAVTGLPAGLVPFGDVYPDHWADNTTPGTTNMTTAINNALAYGRKVRLKDTTYYTTGPIVGALFEQGLICVDGRAVIMANHTAGPVVQFKKSNWRIDGLTLDATVTRQAATRTATNAGLIVGDFTWDDPTDGNAGSSGNNGVMSQCIIQNQPGDGVLDAGGANLFTRSTIQNNAGHGHYTTWGDELGLTAADLGYPGFSTIQMCTIKDNGGHKVAIGGPNTAGGNAILRMDILNCDGSNNATDAAVRFEDREYYIVGEGILFHNNAVGTTGLYVAGRQIRLTQNRFVGNTVATPGQIGHLASYGNDDILIDGSDLNSPVATVTNMWALDAGVSLSDQITIKQANTANETHIASATDRDKLVEWQFGTNRAFNGTVTMPSGTFVPAVRFSTPGDSVVTHSTQEGEWQRVGRFLDIQMRLTFGFNAYTTAGGVLLIDVPGLPFDLDADLNDRVALNVGSLTNVTFAAGQLQVSARVNSANTLRLEFAVSGAPVAAGGTANFPASTTGIGFSISGQVLV